MGKYARLGAFLAITPRESEVLTFAEIGTLIGGPLPDSATDHRQWWENEVNGDHTQAKAWLDAGWTVTDVNLGVDVTFSRVNP